METSLAVIEEDLFNLKNLDHGVLKLNPRTIWEPPDVGGSPM